VSLVARTITHGNGPVTSASYDQDYRLSGL